MAEDWQARLRAERAALLEKLDALAAFLDSPEFQSVPAPDRVLLIEQRTAMQHYLDVLEKRLARLGEAV